jgi:hypothetical protein
MGRYHFRQIATENDSQRAVRPKTIAVLNQILHKNAGNSGQFFARIQLVRLLTANPTPRPTITTALTV